MLKQVRISFNTENEKENKIWELIENKTSKTGAIKDLLYSYIKLKKETEEKNIVSVLENGFRELSFSLSSITVAPTTSTQTIPTTLITDNFVDPLGYDEEEF